MNLDLRGLTDLDKRIVLLVADDLPQRFRIGAVIDALGDAPEADVIAALQRLRVRNLVSHDGNRRGLWRAMPGAAAVALDLKLTRP